MHTWHMQLVNWVVEDKRQKTKGRGGSLHEIWSHTALFCFHPGSTHPINLPPFFPVWNLRDCNSREGCFVFFFLYGQGLNDVKGATTKSQSLINYCNISIPWSEPFKKSRIAHPANNQLSSQFFPLAKGRMLDLWFKTLKVITSTFRVVLVCCKTFDNQTCLHKKRELTFKWFEFFAQAEFVCWLQLKRSQIIDI